MPARDVEDGLGADSLFDDEQQKVLAPKQSHKHAPDRHTAAAGAHLRQADRQRVQRTSLAV